MSNIFKFKRFEVDQSGCAMKINTDGVILGGIAHHPEPLRILDIGTGTGIIALMLAQRFEHALIEAIEIDESAALTALKNVKASAFAARGQVHHIPLEKYETDIQFDMIVSNPPFFVNDLKNAEPRKGIARHADESFFDMLLFKVSALLNKNGALWLILPVKQAERVIIDAVLYSLFPSKVIHIYSDEGKPEFRQVICLTHHHNPLIVHEHFYIYQTEGVYTAVYKKLLEDFFLAF